MKQRLLSSTALNETPTSLSDYHAMGTLWGTSLARCIFQAMRDGVRDPTAHRRYVYDFILPAKEKELLALGASRKEADVYIKAGMATAMAMLNSTVNPLNHRPEHFQGFIWSLEQSDNHNRASDSQELGAR